MEARILDSGPNRSIGKKRPDLELLYQGLRIVCEVKTLTNDENEKWREAFEFELNSRLNKLSFGTEHSDLSLFYLSDRLPGSEPATEAMAFKSFLIDLIDNATEECIETNYKDYIRISLKKRHHPKSQHMFLQEPAIHINGPARADNTYLRIRDRIDSAAKQLDKDPVSPQMCVIVNRVRPQILDAVIQACKGDAKFCYTNANYCRSLAIVHNGNMAVHKKKNSRISAILMISPGMFDYRFGPPIPVPPMLYLPQDSKVSLPEALVWKWRDWKI